jgi:predicted secreted protein
MSDALLGFGTLFQTSDGGSPAVWSTVAEVIAITPPNPSRDNIDLSHENGPFDWRENMPGMKSPGEMEFTFNFVPGEGTYEDLMLEMDDQDIRVRRVVFPDGSVLGFSAFLTSLEIESPLDAQLKATAKFQLSGQLDPIT